MKKLDLIGQRFGKLLVTKYLGINNYGKSIWLCKCGCEKETIATSGNLKSGNSKSCGCSRKNGGNLIHNHRSKNQASKTYNTWSGIVQRCNNKNSKSYKNYGKRKIKVCNRWNPKRGGSFINFLNDVGEIPKGLTLDRTDNNGDYSPDNWRLVPPKEQSRNTRRNINIIYDKKEICLKDYCKIKNLNYSTILTRINHLGWSIRKALNTPVKKYRRK